MVEPIVAFVPMRHDSQRVPGKNYRCLGGRPLYRHILDALLEAERFERIVVDTDSPVVMEGVSANYHSHVELISRPEHLVAPTVSMNEILLHDVSITGGNLFFQTHATNPLLRPSTIARAVDEFRTLVGVGSHDSLFSVTRRQVRIWSKSGQPLNHDPSILLQTQDLEPFFEENSCFYLFSSDVLTSGGARIGNSPAMFEIDPLEATDIDEEHDFRMAEALYALAHP